MTTTTDNTKTSDGRTARRAAAMLKKLVVEFKRLGRSTEGLTVETKLRVPAGTRLVRDMSSKKSQTTGRVATFTILDLAQKDGHTFDEAYRAPIARRRNDGRWEFSRTTWGEVEGIIQKARESGLSPEGLCRVYANMRKLRLLPDEFVDATVAWVELSPAEYQWPGPGGYWRSVALADLEVAE
jgi:hypothetical protein